jgi:hypothetical protein
MSLTESQTDNMGGLSLIWPIAVSSLKTFGDIYDAKINTFSVLSGTSLDPLYVMSETLKFKQEKKDGAEGIYFDTKLEAEAPADRIELQKFISSLENEKYILVFKDNNGQYKVMGTPDQPLNIDAELDAGQVEGALNAYRITFSRKLRQRSPFSTSLPAVALPD